MQENNSQIIIYQNENGETKLDVRFQDETVWLTQKLMAELFQTTPQNIQMKTLHYPTFRTKLLAKIVFANILNIFYVKLKNLVHIAKYIRFELNILVFYVI